MSSRGRPACCLAHRCFTGSQTSWYMGYVAENVRRFFHPAAIDEMLSTFLPSMNCTSLNVSKPPQAANPIDVRHNRVF